MKMMWNLTKGLLKTWCFLCVAGFTGVALYAIFFQPTHAARDKLYMEEYNRAHQTVDGYK